MPDPDLAPLAAHSAALAHLADHAARMAVPLRTRRRRLTGIAIGGSLAVTADEALPSRGGLRTHGRDFLAFGGAHFLIAGGGGGAGTSERFRIAGESVGGRGRAGGLPLANGADLAVVAR